ncbi:MAG: metallophosphoesterase family protein [Saprospiraceae bacterium]|nr:metallophosphoesterase family protein [Saprospiraceae bacterium]
MIYRDLCKLVIFLFTVPGIAINDARCQQKAVPDSVIGLPPFFYPTEYPDHIILNLTADPLASVMVNWRTKASISNGSVQISEATPGPEFRKDIRTIQAISKGFENKYRAEPEIKCYYHSALMDELTPGRKYTYRVGIDTFWSEWFQFNVPNPKRDPLTFIYFGDAQNEVKSMWSRVIREAFRTMPSVDFMLHAGDLINRYNRDLEWSEWFSAGGFINAMVPSIMTPGNHEYRNLQLSPHWKPQFALPTNGPSGLEETCYLIPYPHLNVISLDAEHIDEGTEFKQKQMIWLDSILSNHPKIWTIVTLHYPLYSTKPARDNREVREALKPIFDKYQVDLVLQGHDHAYGRGLVKNKLSGVSRQDRKSGTVYVVSVSGPKMYSLEPKVWIDRKAINTQLFQVISVSEEKLEYKAYTANGSLYDAFELVRPDGQPSRMINHIPPMRERVK